MRTTFRSPLFAIILSLLVIIATAAGCSQKDQNSNENAGNLNNGQHQNEQQPNDPDASEPSDDESDTNESNDSNSQLPDTDPELEAVLNQLEQMTLDQKIGQLVMVGLDGASMTDSDLKQIQDNHVGGFILFGRNIETPEQTNQLINDLKEANRNAGGVPLFFSVDEEGGIVSRMPNSLQKLPEAKTIGSNASPELAQQLSEANGNLLKALGFNMNFAPVLDVDSNPNNPIIGNRAYGETADTVITYGLQTMKGLQSANIIPVVKHFPGHGDTELDSHLDLPVIDHELERLEKTEFAPFKEVVQADEAEIIMVGHLVISAIDPDTPASLSREMIDQMLRTEWGYDGLVITDDMTMEAITDHYGISDAAVKVIQAGGDIVLIGHERSLQQQAITALKQAVESGELTEARIDESVIRILKLKEKYNISDNHTSVQNVQALSSELSSLLEQL